LVIVYISNSSLRSKTTGVIETSCWMKWGWD